MSGSRLRAAVVGVGQVGRLHARVVSECEATELVALVDPDPAVRRPPLVEGVPWLGSPEELPPLSPDFAIVAVPTQVHVEASLPLIEAGIPVLVEKPIAGTLDDARALIEAARERSVLLGIGHVERFNPALRALSEKVRAGALGRIFQIHARRLSPFPMRVRDSGVALELATHDLDLMCELAGRPLRLSAETHGPGSGHEHLLAATIRFDSGIVGLLEANWLTPAKIRELTVTGERGTLAVDYLRQHLTLFENPQASGAWETIAVFEGVTEGDVTRFAIERVEPLRAQLDAFVEAVRGAMPPPVSGEDGLRVVRLALAAVDSGRTGRTVDLDWTEG